MARGPMSEAERDRRQSGLWDWGMAVLIGVGAGLWFWVLLGLMPIDEMLSARLGL